MFWFIARLLAVGQSALIVLAILSVPMATIVGPLWMDSWLSPTSLDEVPVVGNFVGAIRTIFVPTIAIIVAVGLCAIASWAVWAIAKGVAIKAARASPTHLRQVKEAASAKSTPRFALYLRSFDTQKKQNIFGAGELIGTPLSNLISDYLDPFGYGRLFWPFNLSMDEAIAIGFGRKLPLLGLRSPTQDALSGAVEYECTNEEWRTVVHDLWARSEATIIIPGRTAGVVEELAVASQDPTRRKKTVLIMPPRRGDRLVEIEWDLTRNRAAEHGLQLPAYRSGGCVMNYYGFSRRLGSAANLSNLVQRALKHAEAESEKQASAQTSGT